MNSRINAILPLAVSILLPIVGFYSKSEGMWQPQSHILIRWSISALLLYVFWQLLWYFSSEKFKNRQWYVWIVPIIFFGLIHGSLFWLGYPINSFHIVRIIFVSLLIMIIQYAIRGQQDITQLSLEKEQLQTENYKAQLKALHASIDPHFLFNSMNTLRSMVRQRHENSEKFILSLSDFYRQTLKYREKPTIELAEELKVLESYLFLMKSRNEAAISIKIAIDPALQQLQLPTLALQVLVENCFKHNSMTSKMPLNITIQSTMGASIQVSNNIQPKIGEMPVSGYGLALLQKRYELLNVSEGVLIETLPERFTVTIKLLQI